MKKMTEKGFTAVELLIALVALAIIPACLYGWAHNLITLYHSTFAPMTGQIVMRIVGVFVAPLGVVLGYL